MMNKREYDAMVDRVRQHYGNAVEVGGYISGDIIRLQKLAAQIDIDKANERAQRPISEAAGRLHQTRERAMRAWRTITEGHAILAKNRRVHVINGVTSDMLEPIDMPKWSHRTASTVAEYDELNQEAAAIATELETRASKIRSYVSEWERSTMEQQNRSLILALAERLDRLEAERG